MRRANRTLLLSLTGLVTATSLLCACPPDDSDDNNNFSDRFVAFRMFIREWAVKPGAEIPVTITLFKRDGLAWENAADTVRIRASAAASPALRASTDMDIPYPDFADEDEIELEYTITVPADAMPPQTISLTVTIVDSEGRNLNSITDVTTPNMTRPGLAYQGANDSFKIIADDAGDYDIQLGATTLTHFVDLNPFSFIANITDIPDEATSLRISSDVDPDSSLNIRVGSLVEGNNTIERNLVEGRTTITAEWWNDFEDGSIACGSVNPFVVVTGADVGAPATWSFSPLVPAPGANLNIRIEFAVPCDSTAQYRVTGLTALTDTHVRIFDFDLLGAQDFTVPITARFSRFDIITDGACHLLSSSNDLIVHPAGDDLFAGFAGPVTGTNGAMGTLDVTLEYVAQPFEMTTQNRAFWDIEYTETAPENFTVALRVDAVNTNGTFDGPGGEYAWFIRPFSNQPFTGNLDGDFGLTRPDGTPEERFNFSLPPK